jgi:hypothetical protein
MTRIFPRSVVLNSGASQVGSPAHPGGEPWLPYTLFIDEPPELNRIGYWRIAVWALRLGYVALVVVAAGLIATLSGSTPWVLGVGAIFWLAAATATAAGFQLARHELPEPRPGFWSIRSMLIHDSVHARPATQRS